MNKILLLVIILFCGYKNSDAHSIGNNVIADSSTIIMDMGPNSVNDDKFDSWVLSYAEDFGNYQEVIINKYSSRKVFKIPGRTVISFGKRSIGYNSFILYPNDTMNILLEEKKFELEKKPEKKDIHTLTDFEKIRNPLITKQIKEAEVIFNSLFIKNMITKTGYTVSLNAKIPPDSIKALFENYIASNEEMLKISKSVLDSLLEIKSITADFYNWMLTKSIAVTIDLVKSIAQEARLNTESYFKRLLYKYDFLNENLIDEFYNDYRAFIERDLIQNFMPNNKYEKLNNGYQFNYKKAYDSSGSYFSGKLLTYIKFACLKQIKETQDQETFKKYFQKFKNENIPTSKYVTYFSKSIIELKNSLPKGDVITTIMMQDGLSLDSLIKNNVENLIYIDLWASWCIPCRQAMPASEEMRSLYKNKKIIFVYISIDENIEKWKIAAKDENIDTYGYSYILVNPKKAQFPQKFKIESIPRYMLFGKKGKLLHSNAPPPGSEDLKNLLKTYL